MCFFFSFLIPCLCIRLCVYVLIVQNRCLRSAYKTVDMKYLDLMLGIEIAEFWSSVLKHDGHPDASSVNVGKSKNVFKMLALLGCFPFSLSVFLLQLPVRVC